MKAHLETIGQFDIPIVLNMYNEWAIDANQAPAQFVVDGNTYIVKRNSARYGAFTKSLTCFACGLTGTHFLLQRMSNHQSGIAHFNLYGDLLGEPLLFTKDHIIPKSKGGSEKLENFNTMCVRCNMAKGSNQELVSPFDIVSARYQSILLKPACAGETAWLARLLNKPAK